MIFPNVDERFHLLFNSSNLDFILARNDVLNIVITHYRIKDSLLITFLKYYITLCVQKFPPLNPARRLRFSVFTFSNALLVWV